MGLGGSLDGSGDFKELIRRADGVGDIAAFVDVVEFFGDFTFLSRVFRVIVGPLEMRAESHHAIRSAVEGTDGGGESNGCLGGSVGGD